MALSIYATSRQRRESSSIGFWAETAYCHWYLFNRLSDNTERLLPTGDRTFDPQFLSQSRRSWYWHVPKPLFVRTFFFYYSGRGKIPSPGTVFPGVGLWALQTWVIVLTKKKGKFIYLVIPANSQRLLRPRLTHTVTRGVFFFFLPASVVGRSRWVNYRSEKTAMIATRERIHFRSTFPCVEH